MDRKTCSHQSEIVVVLLVTWCVRCSGWQVQRVGVGRGFGSDGCSAEVYERHFLPVEETSPDELQHLIQRALRQAQELEQEEHEMRLFQPDADLEAIRYEHGL